MRSSVSPSVVVASLLAPLIANAAGLSVMVEGQATVFSDIPEVGIKIIVPDNYSLTKSKEDYRRGSFVSYEFHRSLSALEQSGNDYETPRLSELQFFSEASIRNFASNCKELKNDVCFFGDYPDLERYFGQKEAFAKGVDYQEYQRQLHSHQYFTLKKFGDRNWFVSSHRALGDGSIAREYTTFIGDINVDVSMEMYDDAEEQKADALFAQVKILSAAGPKVMIDDWSVMFSDVPENAWHATYVKQAAEAGIVSGYKDAEGNLTGKFGPSNAVTLAEALKIAIEGAGYDISAYASIYSNWEDGIDPWYEQYLDVGSHEGVMFFFGPELNFNRSATRGEVAYMIAHAFRASLDEGVWNFRDVQGDQPNFFEIAALSRDGVVEGDRDVQGHLKGTFRPEDKINRAEVVAIVLRARAKYGLAGKGRNAQTTDFEQNYERVTVTFDEEGFHANRIDVSRGTEVLFENRNCDVSVWIASDPHPSHTAFSPLNLGEIFPATCDRSGLPVGTGGKTLRFMGSGTYGYHNHLNPSQYGTVVVQP